MMRPVPLKSSSRPGVVLILTLMVLIVLATLTYQLTVKLADRRRADDYLIYYQGARYACDSALKYALATTEIIDPNYVDRTEAPDFSDLFRMTDFQIDEIRRIWADELNDPNQGEEGEVSETAAEPAGDDFMSLFGSLFSQDDPNNTGLFGTVSDLFQPELIDANDLVIPGPYGPEWPLVAEPIRFEIGSANVTITIEDENAKLPLVWMTTTEQDTRPAAQEVLRVFCSWYNMSPDTVADLQEKLDEAAKVKAFSPSAAAVVVAPTPQPRPVTPARGVARGTTAQAAQQKPPTPARAVRSPLRNYADYAKLMSSAVIDADWLVTPAIETESRNECPIKYLGIWGATQVNINSAPRHVLEAAFAYGGDGDKIADAIITQRQEEPFASIDDFRKKNLAFSLQIQKARDYITVRSNIFTIRVTATNGPATCAATAVVYKQGRKATKIAAVFE